MADNQTEKQKVQELTDKLERGLTELFNSDSYKNYLSTMSKFHNYSFNNTLLIAMQKPEASLVAGYKAWQKNFDRHVNKGAKAIRILAPAPYKIKEERDKVDPVTQEIMLDRDGNPQKGEVETTIPAFRAVSVFDVSQTDGKPIPELEAKELLSDVEGYQDMIHAVAHSILGRDKDGTLNEEYCKWCYADGTYTYNDIKNIVNDKNDLRIDGLPRVDTRNALVGEYVNLEYTLPYCTRRNSGKVLSGIVFIFCIISFWGIVITTQNGITTYTVNRQNKVPVLLIDRFY